MGKGKDIPLCFQPKRKKILMSREFENLKDKLDHYWYDHMLRHDPSKMDALLDTIDWYNMGQDRIEEELNEKLEAIFNPTSYEGNG